MRRAGLIAASVLLAVLACSNAGAQQGGTGSAAQKPAAAKPAGKPAASSTAAKPSARGYDHTVTTSRTATERPIPREQLNLGRLAVDGGSLGYEGQTQLNAYDMSDGRRVPGYDNIQRNDSSYFGLSLKLRTDSPAFRRHGFE